jgi:hypothetical protein
VLALVSAVGAIEALGEDDFPILGTYTKDAICGGAAAEREDLRVKITRQQISSSDGICDILNRKREGNTFLVHLQCKMPGDIQILGDVTFIMRDANTLDFDDQDHTSPAVLHRCTDK